MYTADEIQEDELRYQDYWDGDRTGEVKRVLKKSEKEQRACGICEFSRRGDRKDFAGMSSLKKNERVLYCIYEHCPLHELDRVMKYSEYDRKNKAKINKALSKAFGVKIQEEFEENEKKKGKTEKKPEPVELTDGQKWTIWVRSTQGYSAQNIAAEFKITEEQAEQEIADYIKSH